MAPSIKDLSLLLLSSRAQVLKLRSLRYPCEVEGVRGLGGNPIALRLLARRLFGTPVLEGVVGRGGRARLAGFDVLDFCACPGQAAPGSGTASAVRMARAAEIALRLAEPRMRGVDIDVLLSLELAPLALASSSSACGTGV